VTMRPFDSFDFGPVGLRPLSVSPIQQHGHAFGYAPNDHWPLFILGLFEGRLGRDEWFRCPVINKLVDLLLHVSISAGAAKEDKPRQTESRMISSGLSI